MGNSKMSGTNEIDVGYVARLARIRLSDSEIRELQPQLEKIVGYVRKVAELDVSGVEPTAHGIPMQNVMRGDVPAPGISNDQAMGNAPARSEGQFLVPRIVE